MNKTKPKKRFRFSVRTLLIVFALVAVLAGLLGGTLSGYLREVRVAKALEQDGADVLLALVPPKRTVNRLLYRFGARKIFHRVINIEFEVDDQITDAMASSIGRLPNLLRLKIEGAVVSDEQLSIIANAPSLKQLTLHRDGKLITAQKAFAKDEKMQETKALIGVLSSELEQPQAISRYSDDEVKAMEARLEKLVASLDVEAQPEPNDPRDFGDDGLRAFTNHPSLQSISVLGCKVSDDALRDVLNSLNSEEDVDQIIRQRRFDELTLCGAQVLGLAEQVNVPKVDGEEEFDLDLFFLTNPAPPPSSPLRALEAFRRARQRRQRDEKAKSLYVELEEAAYVLIRPRDSLVDFSRLSYVLPKGKDWILHLAKHVPLDGKNQNGFRVKNFIEELKPHQNRIRAIVAERDEAELWDIVEQCKNVESVILNESLLSDDDLASIMELTSLKRLAIPNALITTVGLKRLMDSELSLDQITLPKSFTPFTSMIQASGLAKKVVCSGEPDIRLGNPDIRLIAMAPSSLTDRLEQRIVHADFPWPANSPRRPEDEMLYHQRLVMLNAARVLRSKDSVERLNASLKRTPQVNVPVEELMANAPQLRLKYAKQHANDAAAFLKDWQQIAEIYSCMAETHERDSKFEQALEMRVRQVAWAQMSPSTRFPKDRELAELCQLAPDTPRTKLFKQCFFLQANANTTEFEKPPQHMAEWHPQKPKGVPVLAPPGRELHRIRSKKKLSVRTELNPESKLESNPSSEQATVILPARTSIAYVDRSSFPITVETEELSADPFGLRPSEGD